jgi:agmatinase
VDCGDVDMIHMRPEACLKNIEDTVRRIVARKALPVTLGGDHSVPIPIMRALRDRGPLYVIQIDAHLDFVDERFGVREGHGNVMRRATEMPHVRALHRWVFEARVALAHRTSPTRNEWAT